MLCAENGEGTEWSKEYLIVKLLFLREHKWYMRFCMLPTPKTFLGRIDKPLSQIFDLANHIKLTPSEILSLG